MTSTLSVKYKPSIDRVAGTATVSIPQLIPSRMMNIPKGASHCKLVCACAELDFDLGKYNVEMAETPGMLTGSQKEAPTELTVGITMGSTSSLLLVLGIEKSSSGPRTPTGFNVNSPGCQPGGKMVKKKEKIDELLIFLSKSRH